MISPDLAGAVAAREALAPVEVDLGRAILGLEKMLMQLGLTVRVSHRVTPNARGGHPTLFWGPPNEKDGWIFYIYRDEKLVPLVDVEHELRAALVLQALPLLIYSFKGQIEMQIAERRRAIDIVSALIELVRSQT